MPQIGNTSKPTLDLVDYDRSIAYDLLVAVGNHPTRKYVRVFGYNETIGAASETVWTQGGNVSFLTSEAIMNVSSSSNFDASSNTGARTLTISGLDANFLEVTDIVTMNGQTEVATVNSYLRINEVVVNTAGNNDTNIGDVYVGLGAPTAGVPVLVQSKIDAELGKALQCFYTVPASKRAALLNLSLSSFANSSVYATTQMRAKEDGKAWQTQDGKFISQGVIPESHHKFPIIFEEKTDIEIRGKSSGGATDVSASFSLLVTDVI